MHRHAFEIVGSRRLSRHEEPIPITAALHQQVQEALSAREWGVFWNTNFDRAGVGASLFPFRTAPAWLMMEVERLSPLYLLGMPWGAALYLDEMTRTINLVVSSPTAIREVFFADLYGTHVEELDRKLGEGADVLRQVGKEVVGEVLDEPVKGYRFPQRKQASKEKYAEVLFERALHPGESAAEAVADVAGKMEDGLEHTFYWHVSGVAPVSDTARIIMTCHVPYARLAMQMGTYHCPALPCTAIAYAEDGKVKAAMLKPIHMFRTFFRDVPLLTGLRYVRFPFAVRKEISACLSKYLN